MLQTATSTTDVAVVASNYYSVNDQDYYFARFVYYSKRLTGKHHAIDWIAAAAVVDDAY